MTKIVEFIGLVKDMREAQKRYFRCRSHDDLMASKRLEAEVDKWLKERLDKNTMPQGQLF